MFLINYGILDEEKNRILKLKNIKEFDSNISEIMGQIELIFNNSKEGFVDNDIPYSGEFLITWFNRLNSVLIQLKTDSFVAMELPDSDNIWLEFKVDNEKVLVSKTRAEKTNIDKFVVNLPKRRKELFWCESISKDELVDTIIDTTGSFIKDILSINELLSESKEFKRLKDKYIKAKACFK